MKIIKFQTYDKVAPTISSSDDARAVADYRGFYHVAQVHSLRVMDMGVIDTLLEITETMRNDLLQQKEKFTRNEKLRVG